MSRRLLASLAILVGVVLLALAVVYFAVPAGNLPWFIPGHEAGVAARHVKHGIAALALAVAAFVFAWFQTGPASSERA